jgi:transposase-like protein
MSRTKKRHSTAEIASKLEEATRLAADGRNQAEIARALGVSVMTFHRWRKATPGKDFANGENAPAPNVTESERRNRMAELQLENARLRRLITDLLLEKMSLEDDLHNGGSKIARKKA